MKKNMHFVSDLDKFSKEFDRTHELSESQKAEIEKHRRVYELRNGITTQSVKVEREEPES